MLSLKIFLTNNKLNYENIKKFAISQNVIPSIIIGRIQSDNNDYTFMAKYKVQYKYSYNYYK